MKRTTLAIVSLMLAGCGTTMPPPPEFAPNTCEAVQAVLSTGAVTEYEPYTVLRGEPVMLGERALEDNWVTIRPVFGEYCSTYVMRDMFGADAFALKCTPYAVSTSFDRELHEAEAREQLEAIHQTISSCLGDDWTVEEKTEHMDYQVYHQYLYEPVTGRPGADEFDFTVDPLYVELSYTPFMRGRGGPTGWQVVVQFQEMRAMAED